MGSYCGTSGQANGRKIALALTRHLFKDELLKQYSWRGISNSNKDAFYTLTATREVFWKIVKNADCNFSADASDYFLQHSALKHASQRNDRLVRKV